MSPTSLYQLCATAGLDRDARRHRRRQHGIAVLDRLGFEPLHARHRHDAGLNLLVRQYLLGLDRELKLRTGADQDHVGFLVGPPAQHVTALGDAVGAGAFQHRNALARQDQPDRTAARAAAQDGVPCVRGLVGIAGPHHGQVRDRPQRGEVFDRLVGRSVFAQPDRVVRPHVDGVDVHQRREPHRRPHVVGELQERSAVRPRRAVQHDAGQDRTHRVLADTEVQRAAVPVGGVLLRRNRRRPKGIRILDRGVVAAGQVRRPAPQLGQLGSQRGQHLTGGRPGGQRLAARLPVGQVLVPAVGHLLRGQPVQQRLAVRLAFGPRVEVGLPLLMSFAAAVDQLAGVRQHLVAHFEFLVRVEAEDLLDRRDLFVAQRRAVRLAGVHQFRCGITDHGADRDERRLVGDGFGRGDRLVDTDDVLAALDDLHVPAVRLVARRGVLVQRDLGVVLDRDLVVVVEHDEVAELLGARPARTLPTSRPPRCRRRRRSRR